MNRSPAVQVYQQFYVDLGLERTALFRALRDSVRGDTVLYPGGSLHVTPAFFFPHVVVVDRGEHARRFLADRAGMQTLVDQRKRYTRSAFVQFLALDYTAPLPLPDASFDLLLALGAGGIAGPCRRYLQAGGLLVSDNFRDEAGAAARDRGYRLTAVIHARGDTVRIADQGLERYLVPKVPVRTKAHTDYRAARPTYTHTADYYVFAQERESATTQSRSSPAGSA